MSVEDGVLRVVERKEEAPVAANSPSEVEDWFSAGLEIESTDPRAAEKAYERAVGADPDNVAAWINWGRLLHERGATRRSRERLSRARSRSADPIRC